MLFVLLIVLGGLVASSIWVAVRWFQTRKPIREIIADGLAELSARAMALLAWRDRDLISGKTGTPAAELRREVDTKLAARPVPPPPPFAGGPEDGPSAAEVAAVMNAPVPPHWKPVLDALANADPEDYQEHLGILAGEAAGIVAYSEAWFMFAEHQLHSIGIDPAAVQAAMEAADSVGDCAHDFALAGRRFRVIYEAIIQAVEDGLDLPFEARKFFSRDAA